MIKLIAMAIWASLIAVLASTAMLAIEYRRSLPFTPE